MSEDKTPASMGWVTMTSHGSFTIRDDEVLADHDQLPQFFPRTEWVGRDADAKLQEYQCRDRKIPLNEENIDKRDDHEGQRLRNAYKNLHAMPNFHLSEESGDWERHVRILHHLLQNMSKDKDVKWMLDIELEQMLHVACYGMEHSVFVSKCFQIGIFDDERNILKRPVDGFKVHLTDSQFWPYPEDDLNEHMWGRRWIVAPVNFQDAHWCITIFDRETGQLYIFDSATDPTGNRTRGMIHAWAKFWYDLGKPYHFQYFVPSVTQQPGSGECAYLCIAWIMANLRNQVGSVMGQDSKGAKISNTRLMGNSGPRTIRPSSLPLSDWLPYGSSDAQDGANTILYQLRVMICNELGLSLMCAEKDNMDGTQTTNTLVELANLIGYLVDGLDISDMEEPYWTTLGGAQIVAPHGLPKHEQGTRRHAIRDGVSLNGGEYDGERHTTTGEGGNEDDRVGEDSDDHDDDSRQEAHAVNDSRKRKRTESDSV